MLVSIRRIFFYIFLVDGCFSEIKVYLEFFVFERDSKSSVFGKFSSEFCLFTDMFKVGPFGFAYLVLVFLLMVWNYLSVGEANAIKQILYNKKI